MTKPIKIIDVKPNVPKELEPLQSLAYNLWFAWNHDCENLFRRMNPDLWEDTGKNPVELLCRLRQDELKGLSEDEGFLAHMDRVRQELDRYMGETPNPEVFGRRKSISNTSLRTS